MLNKTFLRLLLCISLHEITISGGAFAASEELHPEVQQIVARTRQFVAAGYTDEADGLARLNTNALMCSAREATPREVSAMIDSHLLMELYYAFNTKWGVNKARKHRITYDFLSSLDKDAERTAYQLGHTTMFSVLSIAAQEFFWNEKSTCLDLKSRIRCELRYGLFKTPAHRLNISKVVYLDDEHLGHAIDSSITDELIGKLTTLMADFRAKTIGTTYSAVLDDLNAKLADKSTGDTCDAPLSLDEATLLRLGLNASLTVKSVHSEGDGMCGEHSLFIPTDGPLASVSEGNGRYKILSAIADQVVDDEARRLYLQKSQYMEGQRFVDLIAREIARIRLADASQADALQEKLEAYQKFAVEMRANGEKSVEESRASVIKRVGSVPSLSVVFAAFRAMLNSKDDLRVLTSTEKGKRVLKNVVGELLALRKVNPALNALLLPIDEKLKQLDLEAGTGSKASCSVLEIMEATQRRVDTRKALTTFCEKQQDFARQYVAAKKMPKSDSEEALIALKASDTPLYLELEKLVADAEAAIEAHKVLTDDSSPKEEKLVTKYLLIGDTLKSFLDENMLPGSGHANAFTVEGITSRMGFITDFCQGMCEIVQNKGAKDAIAELMNEFQGVPEQINREISDGLVTRGLELVRSLPELPVELKPAALAAEMTQIALGDGELRGWLPCDAVYTQLWAIVNNVNVFVFAGNEGGMTPPLDVMYREKDNPYSQTTTVYPSGTKGKNLATVIITSPTARNIFMNKGVGHYDKYILPTDIAAMAAQLRHVEWMRLATRYGAYPASL